MHNCQKDAQFRLTPKPTKSSQKSPDPGRTPHTPITKNKSSSHRSVPLQSCRSIEKRACYRISHQKRGNEPRLLQKLKSKKQGKGKGSIPSCFSSANRLPSPSCPSRWPKYRLAAALYFFTSGAMGHRNSRLCPSVTGSPLMSICKTRATLPYSKQGTY